MAFGSSGLHDSAFNVAHALKAFAYAVPLAGLCLDNVAHDDGMKQLTNRLNLQATALELTSTMANNPRFATLLQAYLDDIPATIEQIENCLADAYQEGLLRCVHQLKGTARSYGYPDLGRLAERCQDQLRDGTVVEDMTESVDALLRHLKAIRGAES